MRKRIDYIAQKHTVKGVVGQAFVIEVWVSTKQEAIKMMKHITGINKKP